MRPIAPVVLCLTMLLPGARAQVLAPAAIAVSTAELAEAYLRLDRMIAERPDPQASMRGASDLVDEATHGYFSGGIAGAMARVDRAAANLQNRGVPSPEQLVGWSLLVRIDPPVFARHSGRRPTVNLAPAYPLVVGDGPLKDTEYVLRLRGPNGEVVGEDRFVVGGTAGWTPAPDPFRNIADLSRLEPGAYRSEIIWPKAEARILATWRWQVVETPSSEVGAALTARLDVAAAKAGPDLRQAVGACRSRIGLLTDFPSPGSPTQWLADQHALARALDAEVAALEDGRDPYRRRSGDLWMSLRAGGVDVPLRLYVPPTVAAGDARAPLVITLHGAGGDENMFMDGYGAGQVRALADDKGFVVVSPSAAAMAYPATLVSIVEAIRAWAPVDEQRVGLVGHSMGAGIALSLAKSKPDVVAAVACMAGPNAPPVGPGPFASPAGSDPMPPTLVIVGDKDSFVQAALVRSAIDAARGLGSPVECRVVQDIGHLMVVNLALPDAISWLVQTMDAQKEAAEGAR